MSVPTGPETARTVSDGAAVFDADAIERLPFQRLPGLREVIARVLWRSGGSLAGVIDIPPGEKLSSHVHADGHHHAWILSGTAKILGVGVGPGSYVHIPAGMEHAVEDVSESGLTMFYLYLRTP